MVSAILDKVFELFYNDTRLMQGGTAYATGWIGATREKHNVAEDAVLSPVTDIPIPSNGYVNLFDRPYSRDSGNARPGIYQGTAGYDYTDMQEYPSVSAGHLVEHRAVNLPLVIVCSHNNYYTAIQMRDQLRYNIKLILLDHILENTMWYKLLAPGASGGGELQERAWTSSTGQGAQGITEAMCIIPIRISYQWSKFETRA